MDTLIIQVGARQGRLADVAESEGDVVTLGRSFANDVVLSDPYVAPEQLRIYKDEDQWRMAVLDDTNPVFLNGSPVDEDGIAINSGDKLTIGRTHLSLFSKDHKFETPRKLLFTSWLYPNRLGSLWPLLTVLFASSLSAFYDYLGVSEKFEYKTYISEALMFIFFISLWAALWASVGRLLRHQLHFYANLMFTAIMVSIYIIVAPMGEYVEYLSGSLVLATLFSAVVFLIFLTSLLKFNLSLSSHLKNSGVVALCVSLSLLLFGYGIGEFKKDEFSAYANYANKLKPPFANIRSDQSVEEYMSGFEDQFVELKDMLDED